MCSCVKCRELKRTTEKIRRVLGKRNEKKKKKRKEKNEEECKWTDKAEYSN